MRDRRNLLLGVHLFNGLSAVVGGLALMTSWIPQEPSWVDHTGFSSNYFPGVILLAAVGGSALVAALAMAKRVVGSELWSIVAGMIMVVWIVGEIASIRGFHILQVVYLITGLLVLWWTPGTAKRVDRAG